MRTCYIVGAGEFHDSCFHPCEADYMIAADGGYLILKELDVEPDLLIGDFDSLNEECFGGKKFTVMKLPVEKDDTDILAAIREGIKQGCGLFHIFGGTGGRMDHTLANIQCLTYLSKAGLRGILYGRDCQITAITNATINFPTGQKGVLAVFSMGDRAEGVFIKGFKYEVNDAVFTNDYPIGVSNEFTGEPGSITVRKGTLLIVSYL